MNARVTCSVSSMVDNTLEAVFIEWDAPVQIVTGGLLRRFYVRLERLDQRQVAELDYLLSEVSMNINSSIKEHHHSLYKITCANNNHFIKSLRLYIIIGFTHLTTVGNYFLMTIDFHALAVRISMRWV